MRTDGWQNWPHTQPPFDLGYPNNPQTVPPLNNEELREDGSIELREDYSFELRE
jgi:hypothetical protein